MRYHNFIVTMAVPDDDQTDPADMVEVLQDLLNCKGGAAADWQQSHNDIKPESRAIFAVREDGEG